MAGKKPKNGAQATEIEILAEIQRAITELALGQAKTNTELARTNTELAKTNAELAKTNAELAAVRGDVTRLASVMEAGFERTGQAIRVLARTLENFVRESDRRFEAIEVRLDGIEANTRQPS